MAVCSICGTMFDNIDGKCPECGAPAGGGGSGQSAESLYAEAMRRIKAGQVGDAKGLLSDAISKDPTKVEYHFYLGSAKYKLGDFQGAYKAYQQADKLKPNTDRIHKCLVAARQKMTEEKK
ncbi:MAG: tetratricopeptide repeat protein [Candidatus Omnitrophica bacterium]|nr:tetratricopeptide repeat protein [Candidatus Omnitrophota bacterium]MCA9448163.1 tetratricopeptide repeat protein [Candidatus Omnitrophota bacterium]